MNDENKAGDVACQVGYFYFERHPEGTYTEQCNRTEEDLNSLKLISIEFENDIATISLQRPGLIIGRKGFNIDALTAFIKKNCRFHIEKIVIKESKGIPCLDTYAYAEMPNYDDAYDDPFDDVFVDNIKS